ncbi:unnamed protein product [Camellia sinensis]
MLAMHGVEFFILAFIAAAAAAASVVYGGGFPASLLTLERAFPANQHVELEVLRARDRSRHARILQGVVSGVVNFSLLGNSDQFLGGNSVCRLILEVTSCGLLAIPAITAPNKVTLIKLNYFDPASSATASLVSCSDPICASIIQTAAAECSAPSNQCGYSFQYTDGSGTSGFYVSDFLYFVYLIFCILTQLWGRLWSLTLPPQLFSVCSTNQSGFLIMPDKAIDGIFGFGRQSLSVISQLSSRGITSKGLIIIWISRTLLSMANCCLLIQQCLQHQATDEPLLILEQLWHTWWKKLMILSSMLITAAVSQFATPIFSKGNQCYRVPISITEIFPSVAFNFAGGASMVLRPVDYLVHDGLVDGAAMWCIGFQKTQDQALTILGG